jgi:hypothetical protein
VVIVDEEGQERVTLKPEGADRCSSVAWNPAADLRRTIGMLLSLNDF